MSQPTFARTFKFVGGPSRKRRRCVAPVDKAPVSTSRKSSHVEKLENQHSQKASRTNAVVPAQVDDVPAQEHNDNGGAHTAAPRTDAVTHSATPQATSGGDSENSQATMLSTTDVVLDSLLEWAASADLTMIPEGLESVLDFGNTLPPLNDPAPNLPYASISTLTGVAAPAIPQDESEDYCQQDFDHPLPAAIPFTESSDTTGHNAVRETAPGLGNYMPAVEYIDDKLDTLFAQYNQKFCVWPLTHDFDANPFRFNIEPNQISPLLRHCILALSYKHIHRGTGTCLPKAKAHKKKAVQLLEGLEASLESAKSTTDLLNGLLVLITLDCATSARGPWIVHLRRAQKIIEALGALEIPRTPRIQAQIEMLVWWDVTLGLTSRRGFNLSSSTINSVLDPVNSSDFYSISGCPEELFKYMYQLAAYAHEFELASRMTCVTFDMGPVLAVAKALKEWQPPYSSESDADIDHLSGAGLPIDCRSDPVHAAHYIEDLYHCAQAWRFALLIYVERVFKCRRHEASQTRLSLYARKTLNSMSSCRRSVMVQKQLLLPVFLAACETEDENLREEAREYCRWWAGQTRYEMFITSLGMIEEVWASYADTDSWWGSLIDHKFGYGSTHQYLFG